MTLLLATMYAPELGAVNWILKSTDGGATWVKANLTGSADAAFYTLALDPATSTLYLAYEDDFGGRLNIPLRSTRAKLFIEARYFKGLTSNTDTTVVPITFGIQW
jgi:hypothetical protein